MKKPPPWVYVFLLLSLGTRGSLASNYTGSLVATYRDENVILLFTSDTLRNGKTTQLVFEQRVTNMSATSYYAGDKG